MGVAKIPAWNQVFEDPAVQEPDPKCSQKQDSHDLSIVDEYAIRQE